VRNTGAAPEDFYLDPRLSTSATLALAPLVPNPITLPVPATGSPQEWVVPTESSSVTVTASDATAPMTFDSGPDLGDPDLFSELPTGGSNDPAPVFFSGFGGTVSSGGWYAEPALAAVDGFTAPAPSGATVDLNASAVSQEFDTSMTTTVGDWWLRSVNPAAAFSLLRVNPGQTATITVTVKVPASATAGSVVSGNVYVDTFAPFVQDSGSETAALPYTYTVG